MKNTDKIKKYREYLQERELSEGTISIYVRHARRVLEYADGRKITKAIMMEYKNEICKRNLAAATINLHITAANSFLKYAGYADCRMKAKRMQKRRSLENVMQREEYDCLLQYAKDSGRSKYYYIMKTLASTGIRVSELQFFTVERIDDGVLTVWNKGKSREVYLPAQLITELHHYCIAESIKEGVIFRGNTGNAISRIAVYKMLDKMAEIVGMPRHRAHPHNFRHLFAVSYMNQYANLPELADILGHSSLETTRIYTTTTIEEKRKRMNQLGF